MANIRNAKRKIVNQRVAKLRVENNMDQIELAARLTELSPKKNPVSNATVSMWETGRRNIPNAYLAPLRDIFHVTEPYLYGMTDDPTKTYAELTEEDLASHESVKYQISLDQLYAYHGEPVFVSFPNLEHESEWSLYNRDKNIFVFLDGNYKGTTLEKMNCEYFVKDITLLDDPLRQRKSLDLGRLLELDVVYVRMTTTDRYIHGLYDGWYHHNANHTALQREDGLCLPYSGLKKSYLAYSYRFKDTELH